MEEKTRKKRTFQFFCSACLLILRLGGSWEREKKEVAVGVEFYVASTNKKNWKTKTVARSNLL